MSLFVFFISLLIVAQHVSGNHVPIIRSWRLRDVISLCWYVPWLQESDQVRLVGSASVRTYQIHLQGEVYLCRVSYQTSPTPWGILTPFPLPSSPTWWGIFMSLHLPNSPTSWGTLMPCPRTVVHPNSVYKFTQYHFFALSNKRTQHTLLRVSKSLSHIPQECHGTSLDVSPRSATRASSGEYRFADVSGILSLPNFVASILCILLEGCFSVELYLRWNNLVMFHFYTVHCNIITQHKPTKCTFPKLIF